MTLNFVTLFNANYLSRGLLLYESLEKYCPAFHLYVVAFDEQTYNYFEKFPRQHLTAISLQQFEDEKLLAIKSTRSATEYCWTCTASTVLYAIKRFQLNHCVYIDADLCFYSNPQSLFDEWGTASVLLTEHRYTSEYDQSAISGTYCVQFVGFKNDQEGMAALNYWRNSCIEWCYARAENGKFGDQKYLDDWTTRFRQVHVLQHLGGGLAPWNMQQYKFSHNGAGLVAKEMSSGLVFKPVFFHFHGLKVFRDNILALTGDAYEMNADALNLFYKPYAKRLLQVASEVHHQTGNAFNSNGALQNSPLKPINYISLLRWYLYDIRQNFKNISGRKTISRLRHHHYVKIEWRD